MSYALVLYVVTENEAASAEIVRQTIKAGMGYTEAHAMLNNAKSETGSGMASVLVVEAAEV